MARSFLNLGKAVIQDEAQDEAEDESMALLKDFEIASAVANDTPQKPVVECFIKAKSGIQKLLNNATPSQKKKLDLALNSLKKKDANKVKPVLQQAVLAAAMDAKAQVWLIDLCMPVASIRVFRIRANFKPLSLEKGYRQSAPLCLQVDL